MLTLPSANTGMPDGDGGPLRQLVITPQITTHANTPERVIACWSLDAGLGGSVGRSRIEARRNRAVRMYIIYAAIVSYLFLAIYFRKRW